MIGYGYGITSYSVAIEKLTLPPFNVAKHPSYNWTAGFRLCRQDGTGVVSSDTSSTAFPASPSTTIRNPERGHPSRFLFLQVSHSLYEASPTAKHMHCMHYSYSTVSSCVHNDRYPPRAQFPVVDWSVHSVVVADVDVLVVV